MTDVLLSKMLSMELGTAFDKDLRKHGPVVATEVPFLASIAREGNATARRNATYLLRIARTEDRFRVLADLAATTGDPAVFALAAAGLAPDASARIAKLHPDLLARALDVSEPHVRAAATTLASRVSFDVQAMRTALGDADRRVRDAALEAIVARGVGALEPDVRALFDDPSRRATVSVDLLIRALLGGADPTLATAFARFLDTDRSATALLGNAISDLPERPSWLNVFLIDQVIGAGPYRWQALSDLVRDPDASLEPLVRACRDYLADRAKRGDRSPDTGVNACAGFLGERFARTFTSEATILAFATDWLEQN